MTSAAAKVPVLWEHLMKVFDGKVALGAPPRDCRTYSLPEGQEEFGLRPNTKINPEDLYRAMSRFFEDQGFRVRRSPSQIIGGSFVGRGEREYTFVATVSSELILISVNRF